MEVQPFREQICSITLFLALLVLVNGDLMNSANNVSKSYLLIPFLFSLDYLVFCSFSNGFAFMNLARL